MPSELIVEVVKIWKIEPHPNADRLDLATVKGWQCCIGKGQFKAGDKVVYFPIDSILPPEVEGVLFSADSKVKLSKSRVKTIKLRGAISQGMVAPLDVLGLSEKIREGTDVKDQLGITKYHPPVSNQPSGMKGNQTSKKQCNPSFYKYTGINNIKHYPDAFYGKRVIITEKIHGTNFRAGWVPFYANTLWKKIKRYLNLAPAFEFVYGSHNVQLQDRPKNTETYHGGNVYLEAVEKYNLRQLIPHGEVWYGEVYGDNIQKGYTYGCKQGERKLAIFDIMLDGEWLDHLLMYEKVKKSEAGNVPVLYHGAFDQAIVEQLTSGPSVLCPEQKIREGVVVKLKEHETAYFGRAILKSINPEYLLKDNTEWS